MYKYLLKTTEVLLKAVLDVSKYMFIMIMFLLVDGIKGISPREIDDVFLYSLVIYVVVNVIVKKVCQFNLNKYIKLIVSVAIIVLNIFVAMIFMNKEWNMYSFIVSIVFCAISIKSIIYTDKGLELERELNNYLYSLGALILIFILMFLFKAIMEQSYLQCAKKYLGIYFIIGFASVAKLNLIEEYEKSNSISINKHKNIVRVDMISFIIIACSFVVISGNHLKKLLIFCLEKGLEFTVNFLGMIIKYIFVGGFDKTKNYLNQAQTKPKVVEDNFGYLSFKGRIKEVTEKVQDYIPKEVKEFTSDNIKIIIGVLGVILIALTIYLIYKKLNVKSKLEESVLLEENKDFIFSLNDLKDTFKNIADKIQDSISNKKIHPIRKTYIECVLKLNEKGVKYKKFYTPNEYNKLIKNGASKGAGFDTITEFYNNLRYGNKEITDKQITIAKEIKDKI